MANDTKPAQAEPAQRTENFKMSVPTGVSERTFVATTLAAAELQRAGIGTNHANFVRKVLALTDTLLAELKK